MKKILKLITIGFLFAVSNLTAQKTGFISESKILASLPGYEIAIKNADTIKKQFITEIDAAKTKLDEKSMQLLKPYKFKEDVTLDEIKSKMSDLDKKKLDLLQEEIKLLEKQALSKNEEFDEIYKTTVTPLLVKVNKIISDYCKQNKFDVIYKLETINPAIAYYNEKNDITNAIIELIKK